MVERALPMLVAGLLIALLLAGLWALARWDLVRQDRELRRRAGRVIRHVEAKVDAAVAEVTPPGRLSRRASAKRQAIRKAARPKGFVLDELAMTLGWGVLFAGAFLTAWEVVEMVGRAVFW